jgi:hypothetical protein
MFWGMVVQEAIKCMRHSKRSILTTDDVDSALRLRNVEVVKYFPFLDLVMNFSRRRSYLLSHVKMGLTVCFGNWIQFSFLFGDGAATLWICFWRPLAV